MLVTGTFSPHTGNPVVQYFHGYVVKEMKFSLLNTKMMQLAGDFITVWFMKFGIFLSRGNLIQLSTPADSCSLSEREKSKKKKTP